MSGGGMDNEVNDREETHGYPRVSNVPLHYPTR